MKGFIVTYPGFESFSNIELKKYFKSYNYELTDDGIFVFEFSDLKSIDRFSYFSHTAIYSGIFLAQLNFTSFDDLHNMLKNKRISDFIACLRKSISDLKLEGKKFTIKVSHFNVPVSNDDYNLISSSLLGVFKEKGKLDFRNYDYSIVFHLTKHSLYVGISNVFDMKTRPYKIYLSSHSLSGPNSFIADALAGFFNEGNNHLLCYLSNDGIMGIEAALFLHNISPRMFDDRMKFFSFSDSKEYMVSEDDSCEKKIVVVENKKRLDFAVNNSIISGANEFMEFKDSENFLKDVEFGNYDNFFDGVVSLPPVFNNRTSKRRIERFFDKYFALLNHVLKKGKSLVFVAKKSADFEPAKAMFEIERIDFDKMFDFVRMTKR